MREKELKSLIEEDNTIKCFKTTSSVVANQNIIQANIQYRNKNLSLIVTDNGDSFTISGITLLRMYNVSLKPTEKQIDDAIITTEAFYSVPLRLLTPFTFELTKFKNVLDKMILSIIEFKEI